MTNLFIVGAVIAGTALLVGLAAVVPRERARGAAISAALVLVLVFAQNPVPEGMRVGAQVLAIALVLLGEARTSRRAHGRRSVWAAIAGWWAMTGIGVVLNDSYSPAGFMLQTGLIVLLAWSLSRATAGDLRWAVGTFLAFAAVGTALGAFQVGAGAEPLWGYGSGIERKNPFLSDTVRAQGTFGHPIVFGFTQGLALVIAWINPTRLAPRVRVPLLLVILAGLALSGTRSAVAVAVAAIVFHVLTRFRLVTWLRGASLMIFGVAVVLIIDLGLRNIVEETVASGSWVHRIGSLEALPRLLGRRDWEYWWGSGFGSEKTLFTDGYIHLTYGLPVVDNLFVYLLGTVGVGGWIITAALLGVAFVSGSRFSRSCLVYVVAMFFSFDLVVWISSSVVVFVTVAFAGLARSTLSPSATIRPIIARSRVGTSVPS